MFDTGAEQNLIRRSALPEGWRDLIATNKDLRTLCDASDHVLYTTSEILLRVRFINSFYRVTFIVLEKLSYPFFLRTKFLNRHIDAYRCRKGTVQFTGDTLSIFGNQALGELWRDRNRHVSEFQDFATLEDGKRVKTGYDNWLNSVLLAMSCTLPPNSQNQVLVTSHNKGLIVIEPKGSISTKLGIRVMNNFHEVIKNRPLTVPFSNFCGHAMATPSPGFLPSTTIESP